MVDESTQTDVDLEVSSEEKRDSLTLNTDVTSTEEKKEPVLVQYVMGEFSD